MTIKVGDQFLINSPNTNVVLRYRTRSIISRKGNTLQVQIDAKKYGYGADVSSDPISVSEFNKRVKERVYLMVPKY